MPETRIAIEDPRDEDVRRLLERHLDFAHRHSPPEDIHALEVDALLDPAITFYGMREDGALLAIGALKQLDSTHGELKSMHTAEEARGRGLGRTMLQHLLDKARGRGLERVSLETGSMEAFAPARSLYASVGFEPCEPFGNYASSRNSEFLTMTLEPAAPSGP
ncbi:MAG TPA: GNAT family N-acetyltransferase [Nocardioidaceae bacterium]|nr:GNAT family N-acetyltransferase [Nocardioidaceae bacterium]